MTDQESGGVENRGDDIRGQTEVPRPGKWRHQSEILLQSTVDTKFEGRGSRKDAVWWGACPVRDHDALRTVLFNSPILDRVYPRGGCKFLPAQRVDTVLCILVYIVVPSEMISLNLRRLVRASESGCPNGSCIVDEMNMGETVPAFFK